MTLLSNSLRQTVRSNRASVYQTTKLVTALLTVALELWGQRGTFYPPSSGLVPPVPPSQRCGLFQNFKQTTLTTRLYNVRTKLYPPLTKMFRCTCVLRVVRVTVGLVESNGSLTPGWVYDSRHLQADCQELGSAPEPYARYQAWATFTCYHRTKLHCRTIIIFASIKSNIKTSLTKNYKMCHVKLL